MWRPLVDVFLTETAVKGVPLLILTLRFMANYGVFYCPVVNCSMDQLRAVVPASRLVDINNLFPFLPAYADAVQERGCSYLPFTSDEWFTMKLKSVLEPEQYEVTRQLWSHESSFLLPITLPGVPSESHRTTGCDACCALIREPFTRGLLRRGDSHRRDDPEH